MRVLHEDRALLEKFRRGDAEALTYVYRTHVQRLSDYLRAGFSTDTGGRVGGLSRQSELEDAIQEIFIRAFRDAARASYDGLRPFEGWLVGIAHNYAVSELRRRRLPVEPLSHQLERKVADTSPTESIIEDRELEALLKAFVATLSEREQAVYHARFDRELSQEQAAKALNLTRIQVRRVDVRLRSRLLANLKERGYLPGIQPDALSRATAAQPARPARSGPSGPPVWTRPTRTVPATSATCSRRRCLPLGPSSPARR